jgi:hypothetical protein
MTTVVEEVSGVAGDPDEAGDDSGDEGEVDVELHGASDARGVSTTSTASSKRPVEDEDEEAPASKRMRSEMITAGGSKRGRKPLPSQEPQVVSRMSSAGERN